MVAHVLSDDVLAGCAERAPEYDRENRFFSDDFEELRQAGYLLMAVPEELGGKGMTLAEVCREESRLAYHAPATALATNMHIYWTGVAADLWRAGDKSLTWILEEAANGEVYAAGHGERGNDFPLLASTARAERVDGGYKLYGHKMFGSLTPVWTRLGIHAMDTSDPENPKVVHVFMPRDTDGYRIEETWDTLGMRATRSDDTILEGAFVPDQYVARIERRRSGGRRRVRPRHLRLGTVLVRQHVSRHCATRARSRDRRAPEEDLGRARSTVDGVVPAEPVDGLRDVHRRSKARPRTSSDSRKTGQTASTTAVSGRRSSSPRSTTRSRPRSGSSTGRWI